MPVNITPEYERVWKYFSARKNPVTVKQVMKALLVSEAQARRALEYFVFKELADRIKSGNKHSYRIKE
jgi:Fic family protein